MADILVLVEHADGALRTSARELLTLARTLGTPHAVVDGAPDTLLPELGQLGVTTVLRLTGDPVAEHGAPAMAEALAAAVHRVAPALVLLSATFENKEVASRLAVLTTSGAVVDASDVTAVDGGYVIGQSAFTGTYTVRSVVTTGTPIVAVKPNMVVAADADTSSSPVIEDLPIALTAAATAATVTERTPRPSSGRPDLAEAAVVVAGGRGLDGDFGPVDRLADVLGGAVGSTRVAVDEGWIDHTTQIGQTGVTVTPKLYIGAGISGAIHHRSGMQGAQTIVAINADPEAPIFEIADFGIVGDAATVLDQTTAAITARKG